MEWLLMGVVVVVVGVGSEARGPTCRTCDAPPEVSTQGGRIRGLLEVSTRGRQFFSYYGIPYAKPPVGRLRLKDPVPAEPWEGVRNGSIVPQPCVQLSLRMASMGLTLPPDQLVGLEDCLFLNVFTPTLQDRHRPLPVMVFIHGGGYLSGGSRAYLPDVLLNHNIVLVVLQYRLGVLGFLSTEDSVMPGNLGLKDQTLALHWVKDNIQSFGGDPDSVTIFGESAGGASVHFQVLSPKAKGLFSRAIMQSGSAISPLSMGRHHRQVAEQVATSFGCPTYQGSRALLACLQTLDAKQLQATVQNFFVWYVLPQPMGPRVDGDFIPVDPNLLIRSGLYNPVDLMTGTNSHEGAIIAYPLFARDDLSISLKTKFSSNGPVSLLCCEGPAPPLNITTQVYNRYLGGINLNPATHAEQIIQMFGDWYITYLSDLGAMLHAKNFHHIKKSFSYELQHRGQLSFGDSFVPELSNDWVNHADDLFYLFRADALLQLPEDDPARPKDLTREVDLKVRDIITTLWTNFATYGNPTPDDSLGFIWEPVIDHNLRYLAITATPTMDRDKRNKNREFLKSLPTSQNLILHSKSVFADTSHLWHL